MDPSSNTAPESGRGVLGPRRPGVDAVRGAAVVAMVIYHSAWDLTALNLIETDVTQVTAWRWFARAIAASFLVIVGIGLVLAHGREVRLQSAMRRVAVVAGAAALVTAVTVFVFPTSYIFFGILHNIALSSLIALPFVRWPFPVAAAAAALVLFAPLVVSAPALDAPLLAFLGFGSQPPVTNDFVPLFPWTGFVLAGIAAARAGGLARERPSATTTGPSSRPVAALGLVGRHSLAIYLLHQPLIFGLLWGLVQVVGPNPVAEAAPFMNRCTSSCAASRAGPSICQASCSCTVGGLRQAGLWRVLLAGRESAEELQRAGEIAQGCLERNR